MAPRPHAEYRTFQGPRAMNAAPNAPVRSSRMPRKPKASVPAMGGNGATTSGPARRLWAEVDNNASAAIVPAIPAGAPVVPGAVAAAPAAVATAAPTKLSFKPISRAVDRASEDTVAGPNNELIHHDPMAIDSAEENVDEPAYTIGLRIEALKALKGPALENALRVFQCDKLYAQLENDLEKLAVEEKKARNFFGKYDGPAPIFKRDLDEGIKQLLLNRLTAIGACTGRSAKELMEKHGVTQRIADLLYLSERMLAISCSMANPAYTNGPCFGMRHIDAFVPLPKIEDQKVACTIVPDRYIGILGEEDGYTYTGLNDGRQRSLRDLGFESLIDFDLAKSNLEAPMKLTSKDMKVLLQINAALEKELPPRIKEYIVTYREQLERSLNASSKEKGVAGDLTQGAGPSGKLVYFEDILADH